MTIPHKKRTGYILRQFSRISETFILNEILELEKLGFNITIFTRSHSPKFPLHDDISEVKADILLLDSEKMADWLPSFIDNFITFILRPGRYLKTFQKMRKKQKKSANRKFFIAGRISRYVLKQKINHIHAHFATHNTKIARLVSKITGVKYSFTAHAKDIWVKSTPSEVKRMLDSAKFAVTICQYNKDYLSQLAAKPKKIHLIYNGLDLKKFSFSKKQMEKTDQNIEILAVGRLIPKKGFHVLVAACRELIDQKIQFKCRVVGDGLEFNLLEQLIQKNGLEEHFFLKGACSQEVIIKNYLSKATVFVMPCIIAPDGDRDGIPTVILEAMSMGIPVIASSVAGIPEVVIHKKTGLLVEPGSSVALSKALLKLIEEKDLRGTYGKKGAELIKEMFNRKKNVKKLAHLFSGGMP